jgi:Second Messenger Oligonucleotide or Dinucleotide Synthetase domain
MATMIDSAFAQYKANLELTDRQEGLVSNTRANVVAQLAAKISLASERSQVIGSYDRHTLTRYLSEGDVDVLVTLAYPANAAWNTSAGATQALDKFKAVLDAAYPSTRKRRDRHCITMHFAEFRLDLVPAFKYDDGHYTIPDSVLGRWIETDPIAFAALITNLNKVMGGTFIPLIKMVKGWNRNSGWPISSFHLECLMYAHCKDYTLAYTYPSLLKIFFEALPALLGSPSLEPTRGERVDGYMDVGSPTRRATAILKARLAAAKAAEAYKDETVYGPSVSVNEWKAVLGDFFPSYG